MFGSRKKLKSLDSLVIKRGDIEIKQYTKVTYLGCELDHTLSGESMVTKVLGKINGRLKFLYRKQAFLNFSLRRMLCNVVSDYELLDPRFIGEDPINSVMFVRPSVRPFATQFSQDLFIVLF